MVQGSMTANTVSLLDEAGCRPVLRLHPAVLAGSVRVTVALGDDPFEATVADRAEERVAVLERRDETNGRPLKLEQLAPLGIRQHSRRQPLHAQDVEHEVDDVDPASAVKQPPPHRWKSGLPSASATTSPSSWGEGRREFMAIDLFGVDREGLEGGLVEEAPLGAVGLEVGAWMLSVSWRAWSSVSMIVACLTWWRWRRSSAAAPWRRSRACSSAFMCSLI
jgi:hypothetical protein